MNIAIAVALRCLVVGAGCTAYLLAVPLLFPGDGEGANIGAGLLAFALVAVLAGGWAVLDGRRQALQRVLGTWAAAAGVLAVGGLVALSAIRADATLGMWDMILLDASLVPFVFTIIAVPAAAGAAIGAATR